MKEISSRQGHNSWRRSRDVGPQWFFQKAPSTRKIPNQFGGVNLTGAKRREWMGCWGLLGLLLLVMKRIIPDISYV